MYSREYMPLPGPPANRYQQVDDVRIRVLLTRRERTATSKEYLHGCKFVDIVIVNANAFKGDIDVVELGLRIMNEPVTTGIRGFVS